MRNRTRDKHHRRPARLDTDYYGELFMIVDSEGNPVTDYMTDLDHVRDLTHEFEDFQQYRIARVGYKVVGLGDPEEAQIADDPLEVE